MTRAQLLMTERGPVSSASDLWWNMSVRLPRGQLERINFVLRGGEQRSEFVRDAIETELLKREQRMKIRADIEAEIEAEIDRRLAETESDN